MIVMHTDVTRHGGCILQIVDNRLGLGGKEQRHHA